MEIKVILPVVDTEYGKFEYKGKELTREEFGNLEYIQFLKTNSQVGRFVDNMRHGISNYDTGFSGRMRDADNRQYADIIYNFEEVSVIATDSKKNEITPEFFIPYADNGKMFIVIFNFNPDTLTGDAKSELRFWAEDSQKVLNDIAITDELKLRTLPMRHFFIECGDKKIALSNCKIVQNYSNKKNPFHYGIIIEKAIYTNGKK